jgi:hypothetical protein
MTMATRTDAVRVKQKGKAYVEKLQKRETAFPMFQ